MVEWKILGINKTKDKDIIKNAYRSVLAVTNPEDNAKKFMELRREYEEAIAWAEIDDSGEVLANSVLGSPVDIWIEKIKDIYEDFEQRIDSKNWTNLLNDDVCIRLDYKIEARDMLLDFLMSNYNLPHDIWKMIDNTFDIIEQKDELYEIFPKEYIDNAIISSIKYEDIIDYSLFNMYAMADYDEFITTYYYLVRAMKEHNYEECERLFNSIEKMGDVHPYVNVEKVKYLIRKKENKQALDIAQELYDEYPESNQIIYIMAEALLANDDICKAKELYQLLHNKAKDNYYVKVGIADCLMKEGKYEEAKNMYVQLHKENPYDCYLKETVEKINQCIIEKYEKECGDSDFNQKKMIELGWCYLQNNRVNDALAIAVKINKDEDEYEYYNLLGRCYLYLERYDEAIITIKKWAEVITNLEDDYTEETIKRKERLGYAYEILCQIYEVKNNKSKALEYINKALEVSRDNKERLEIKARIYLEMKKYDKCNKVCEIINNLYDNSFICRYIKGVSYYKQRMYDDAMEEFVESTKIYPYYIPSYLYRIKIFFKYGEYDRIKEIIQYLEKKIEDSDSLIFYKAKLDIALLMTQVKEKQENIQTVDFDSYIDIFQKIIDNYNNDKSDIFEIDAVYCEMAALYIKQGDFKNAIEFAVKAVDNNEDNIEALVCLSFIYENIQEYNLAIGANKRILEINPTFYGVNNKIAELYEYLENYEEAIVYHTKQLELNDNVYFYMSRGLVYLQLDMFEEARQDFFKSIEGNMNNPHPYNNIGASYQYEDNYEEAIKYYKLAIECMENEPTPLPYRNLATVYMRMKKTDKAIECYKENIRLFNESYDYEEMSVALFELLRYKEAVEVYTQMYKCFEENKKENKIGLYVWVGKCNFSLGAQDTALKYFLKAIEETKGSNIKYANAYIEIAEFYQLNNDFENAIKYYSEIENDDLLEADNYADYAYVLQKIGNVEKAEKVLKKAFEKANAINNKQLNRITYKFYVLGYCYTISGDYDKAKEYYNKALCNRKCNTCDFPKCSEALGGIAFMYELMGNYAMAAKYYKEALGIVPSNIRYIYGYRRVTEKDEL